MQRCKGKGVERVRGTGTQKFKKSPPNELLAGRSKKQVRGEEGKSGKKGKQRCKVKKGTRYGYSKIRKNNLRRITRRQAQKNSLEGKRER